LVPGVAVKAKRNLGIHGEGPSYCGLTFPTGFACGGSIEEEEEEEEAKRNYAARSSHM
jgi:hypothetical protein